MSFKDDDGNKVVQLVIPRRIEDGIPCDEVLEHSKGLLEEVIVIGWEKDTQYLYASGSTAKKAELLHLLDLFKHQLLAGDYD